MGVKNEPREVVGLENPQAVVSRLTELIKVRIDPTPRYRVREVEIEGKSCVDLEVQDGPAAMIGLRPGDVISHLNNQAVASAKQFTEIAKDLPKNRSVSMRVLRQGRASFITFKLAE